MQSEREKNYFNFYQKKVATLFLESWYSMTIESNSMILRHEIVPVYRIFSSFLRVVSNLPHFLSGIR